MSDNQLAARLRGGVYALQRLIANRLSPPKPPRSNPVHAALEEILRQDTFTIVQIGAYIGNTSNDPLFHILADALPRSRGRLICVEPDERHFKKLVENYRGLRNVHCENAAISNRSGPATFYRLNADPADYGLPEFLSQLGSLKKDRMESLWDRYEANAEYKAFYLKHRVEETVNCITFEELLRRHNVAAVDLLQMDVEGYELEILRTIDFHRAPIRFVNYECVLLHEFKQPTELLMRGAGYRLVDHGQDTFCYKNSDRRLAKRWCSPA